MKNVICVNCRKHVEHDIQYVEAQTLIKGKKVVYMQAIAHCKECGMEVWAEEVDNLNSISPIVAYCEMKGLITPVQIKEGLQKYNIGSHPLSNLLGWSEITISRFLNGRLPSKAYSDKLMEIFGDPKYFQKILLKNKSKITPIAYEKALKSLNTANDSFEETSCFVCTYTFGASIDYTANRMQGGANRWQRAICNC